jgi:hypothetical protein
MTGPAEAPANLKPSDDEIRSIMAPRHPNASISLPANLPPTSANLNAAPDARAAAAGDSLPGRRLSEDEQRYIESNQPAPLPPVGSVAQPPAVAPQRSLQTEPVDAPAEGYIPSIYRVEEVARALFVSGETAYYSFARAKLFDEAFQAFAADAYEKMKSSVGIALDQSCAQEAATVAEAPAPAPAAETPRRGRRTKAEIAAANAAAAGVVETETPEPLAAEPAAELPLEEAEEPVNLDGDAAENDLI